MNKTTLQSWIISFVTIGAMIYATVGNVAWLKTLLCVYFNLVSILIMIIVIVGVLVILYAPNTTHEAFVKIHNTMKNGFIRKCFGWVFRIFIVWFLVVNSFVGTTIMYILCIIVTECFKLFIKKVAENE